MTFRAFGVTVIGIDMSDEGVKPLALAEPTGELQGATRWVLGIRMHFIMTPLFNPANLPARLSDFWWP